jgi:hypothetical protein
VKAKSALDDKGRLPAASQNWRQYRSWEDSMRSIGTLPPMFRHFARLAACLVLTVSLHPAYAEGDTKVVGQIPIAFAGFGFTDSSGEAVDQQQAHAARLLRLKADLEAGLGQSGKYRVILLSCPTQTCGASDAEAAELARQAKEAGAELLLIGGIHKMSTLIMWMKADVLDVNNDKQVFDRLLTFRGDNDEALDHAKDFLLHQLRDLGG